MSINDDSSTSDIHQSLQLTPDGNLELLSIPTPIFAAPRPDIPDQSKRNQRNPTPIPVPVLTPRVQLEVQKQILELEKLSNFGVILPKPLTQINPFELFNILSYTDFILSSIFCFFSFFIKLSFLPLFLITCSQFHHLIFLIYAHQSLHHNSRTKELCVHWTDV